MSGFSRLIGSILILLLLSTDTYAQDRAVAVVSSVDGSALHGTLIGTDAGWRGYTGADGEIILPSQLLQSTISLHRAGYRDTTLSLPTLHSGSVISITPIRTTPVPRNNGMDLRAERLVGAFIAHISQNRESDTLLARRRSRATGIGAIHLKGNGIVALAVDTLVSSTAQINTDERWRTVGSWQTGASPYDRPLEWVRTVNLRAETVELPDLSILSPFGDQRDIGYEYYLLEQGENYAAIEIVPKNKSAPSFSGTLELEMSGDAIGSGTFILTLGGLPASRALVGYSILGTSHRTEGGFAHQTIQAELIINALLGVAGVRMFATGETMRAETQPPSSRTSARIFAVVDSTGRPSLDSIPYAPPVPTAALGIPLPWVEFNRVGSVTLGVAISPSIGPIGLAGRGGYSLGLERPVGDALVRWNVLGRDRPWLTLYGELFSRIATTTTDNNYPRVMNTLVAATLHQDYYDYYRKDGWRAGIEIDQGWFVIDAFFEQSRQFTLPVVTDRSIIFERPFRDNPIAVEGAYTIGIGKLDLGYGGSILSPPATAEQNIYGSVVLLHGARRSSNQAFSSIEGRIGYSLPLWRTSARWTTLSFLAAAGVASDSTPTQYQFRLQTSAAAIGRPGGFISPKGGLYGGTRYAAVGFELNTYDWLWRGAGLPLYKGRGPDFIVAGTSGRFDQGNSVGYRSTGGEWYNEIGIGIGRIPIFISDLLTVRVDARYSLGPVDRGRIGVNLTLGGPF